MSNDQTVPEGYMRNAKDHLVHVDDVREQDLLRDQVARKWHQKAIQLNALLKEFKEGGLGEINDLVKIAGERYQVALGGDKGNVTISSYDGRIKVQRCVADVIVFTEEIEAAKALMDQCMQRWTEGANQHVRGMLDRAFRKTSKGQLKTGALLDLMRMEVDDEEWKQAMNALRDSIQVSGTSTYIRVYHRVGKDDKFEAIPLDLAAV